MALQEDTLHASLSRELSGLSNAHRLTLTTLSSSPKRTTALFPHAPSSLVRCHEVEHLVTLSSDLPVVAASDPPVPASSTAPAGASETSAPAGSPTAHPVQPVSPVLTSAVSAFHYTLPSPSRTTVLYISKVDSSGYTPVGSPPLTRELVVAFLAYFLRKHHAAGERCVVTLFARSQAQYLFPDSSQGGGKKVLGGLGLCGWWKGVYEEVARRLTGTDEPDVPGTHRAAPPATRHTVPRDDVRLTYLLPSYSAAEAAGMLGVPRKPLPAGLQWAYDPPFASRYLPLSTADTAASSLATLIPSLPDDPKTRFLDELVYESSSSTLSLRGGPSAAPLQHSRSASVGAESADTGDRRKKRSRKERNAAEEEDERRRATVALAKLGQREFWERMGFRQECISGDVTGFFTIAVDGTGRAASTTASTRVIKQSAPPLRPLGPASSALSIATAVDEDSPEPPRDGPSNGISSAFIGTDTSSSCDLKGQNLSGAVIERILASLLNTDFGSLAAAIDGTATWTASTKSIVVDEMSEAAWAACRAIIEAKVGLQAPVAKRKEEPVVTMLQVRKKKKV